MSKTAYLTLPLTDATATDLRDLHDTSTGKGRRPAQALTVYGGGDLVCTLPLVGERTFTLPDNAAFDQEVESISASSTCTNVVAHWIQD